MTPLDLESYLAYYWLVTSVASIHGLIVERPRLKSTFDNVMVALIAAVFVGWIIWPAALLRSAQHFFHRDDL